MKILHTGDWHIGKVINDFSLLDDQIYILNELFKVIDQEQPDCILITGDVYDRSIPPKEAVEVLNQVLTTLIEDYKLPTFIVSGNHDSQERLSFGNKMLEHKKLYIQGNITEEIKKVILNDEHGNVNFYLLPYAHPAIIRNLYQDDTIDSHNQAFVALMNRIKKEMKLEERNILITHNFIMSNPEEILQSESERNLSIGGMEYVDVNQVLDFDYVALGHLHQHQKVYKDHIRYSGSILKYSFSEVERDKGVVITEIKNKGEVNHRFIPLKPKKDLRFIEGKMDELMHPNFYSLQNCEDYLLVKLTDELDIYDPINRLRTIYPNIMQLQRKNLITNVTSNTKASHNFKSKSKLELFEEFYHNIVCQNLDDLKQTILKKAILEVESSEVK